MTFAPSDTKHTIQAITYERAERHVGGRKIRRDALPEHWDFEDGGCELAPACLRCPLEICRYDQPGGARVLRQTDRNETLRRFRAEGSSIDELALQYNLTRRSVFRILAKGD
jgi:Helix-turn-helix domain of resolvase